MTAKTKDNGGESVNKGESMWGGGCLRGAFEHVFMMIGTTNMLPLIRTQPIFKLRVILRSERTLNHAHTEATL